MVDAAWVLVLLRQRAAPVLNELASRGVGFKKEKTCEGFLSPTGAGQLCWQFGWRRGGLPFRLLLLLLNQPSVPSMTDQEEASAWRNLTPRSKVGDSSIPDKAMVEEYLRVFGIS